MKPLPLLTAALMTLAVLPARAQVPAMMKNFRPPSDSLFCKGHVTGAPRPDGTSGPHITWEAFHSPASPDVLVQKYLAPYGAEGYAREDGCTTWRMPPDKPERVVTICPVSAEGPWQRCASDVPGQAASIILLSSITRRE